MLGLWAFLILMLPSVINALANLVWAFRCDPRNSNARPPRMALRESILAAPKITRSK